MNASIASAAARPVRDLATAAILVVASICFLVHVVLLMSIGISMLPMTLPMLALSGLCVACTSRARGLHARRDYLVAAAAGLTMIVLHLLLMPSRPTTMAQGMDHAGMNHAGMDHAGTDASSVHGLLSAGVIDGLMQTGIALAVIQLVLAIAASARQPGRRVQQTTPRAPSLP